MTARGLIHRFLYTKKGKMNEPRYVSRLRRAAKFKTRRVFPDYKKGLVRLMEENVAGAHDRPGKVHSPPLVAWRRSRVAGLGGWRAPALGKPRPGRKCAAAF